VSNFLIPILVFTIPVIAIVLLALLGRRLSGSCGGSGDGSCSRCGRPAGTVEPGDHACKKSKH